MPIEADLHMHSHHSDGVLPPPELMRRAREVGLSLVALTDHDSVDGIEEARAAAPPGLEVIGGAELSSSWRGREIHLLVYGLDPRDEVLRGALEALKSERRSRAQRIIDRLQAVGVSITTEEVESIARRSGAGDRISIGRPHIADAIVARGAAADIDEAFARYLRRGQPAYVPRQTLPVRDAISLARMRGAAIVVAHPALNLGEPDLEALLHEGLDGLEVQHPKHSDDQRRRLAALAARLDLIPTGGSDYHGPGRNRHELGSAGVGRDTVDRLRDRAQRAARER